MITPKTVALTALAAAASAVAFAPAALAQSVIETRNVNRDAVPAGTPAAFVVAFPDAERNEAVRDIGEDAYSFVPLAFIALSDTRVALVSTGVNDCTGQACTGLNAVHYLSHDAGEPRYPYSLQGEWLDVGAVGVMGNPALQWGWSRAITEHPVLFTEAGGVWQGRACGYAVLTELTPSGPKDIARIPTSFSDASAEGGDPGVEGVITSVEKGRSFTVSYTGSASFDEIYKRGADGEYRLDGKSRVTTC